MRGASRDRRLILLYKVKIEGAVGMVASGQTQL